MSLNQSKAERSEAQLRKPGKCATAGHQRGSNVPGKGGGAGGTAPPGSVPTASTNRGGKRPNGPSSQSRGNSNSNVVHTEFDGGHKIPNEGHDQSQQQCQLPSVPAGAASTATKQPNAATSKSSRALPRPPTSQAFTAPISDPASPVPTTVAPGEVSRATIPQAFAFQFGSISPGFINGMQIPARTSSAPPNLDEQKRERTRFEAVNASSNNVVPAVSLGPRQQNGPQQQKDQDGSKQAAIMSEPQPAVQGKRNLHVPSSGLSGVQTQKPPLLTGVGISSPIQFQQSQAPCTAVQMPYSIPSSQMQSQVGTPGQQRSLPFQLQMATAAQAQVQPHVFVPQNLQSHSLQSQGMVHQGQPLNYPQLNQISHQMGSQLGAPIGAQLPMGMGPQFVPSPVNQYIPQRTNKAVKITHPETHEELRFDKKSDSYMDAGPPGSTSLPVRLPANGLPQSRPSAHPVNFYSPIQTGSYSHTSSHFQPPKTSVPTIGIPPSSAPSVRYSFPHSTSGQNMPFVSHSGFNMPPVVKPGLAGVSTSEQVSLGSIGPDGNAPLVSVPAVLGQTQASVHATVSAVSQRQGASPSLSGQLGDTPMHNICRGDLSHNVTLNPYKQITQVAETDLIPQKFGDVETSVSMHSVEKDASIHSSLCPNSATVMIPSGGGISESQQITSTTEVPASKTLAVEIKQSTLDTPVAALSKASGTVISSMLSVPASEVGTNIPSGEIRRSDSAKRVDVPLREHPRKIKQRPQRQQHQQQQAPSTVPQQASSTSLTSKSQAEGKDGDVSEVPSSNSGIANSETEKRLSTQIKTASKLPSQKIHHSTTTSLIESDDRHATSGVASEFDVRGNALELPSEQLNSESTVVNDENSLGNVKQHLNLGTTVLEATAGALAHVCEKTETVVDGLNFGDFVEVNETSSNSISELSNIGSDSRPSYTSMQCFKVSSQVDESSVVSDCVSTLLDSQSTRNTEKPPDTVDPESFITNEQTSFGDPNTVSCEVSHAALESRQKTCAEDALDHDGNMASEMKGDSVTAVAELIAGSNVACKSRGRLVAGASVGLDVSSTTGQSAFSETGVPSCDKVSDFELISSCRDEKADINGCGSEPGQGNKSKVEVVAVHNELSVSTSNGTCGGEASIPYHQASVLAQSEVKNLDLLERGTEKSTGIISSNIPPPSKDKQGDEQPTKPKYIASKKKKKKEILIKADAAGTVDLYNAYKAPEGKREEVNSLEVLEVVPSAEEKTLIKESENISKNELDDWEDAAEILSPKINATESVAQISMTEKQVGAPNARSAGDRKYTRDFLLRFRDHFRDLPPQFEIQADMEHILNFSAAGSQPVDHEASPGLGRALDRQLSGGPRLERRGNNMGDEDRWMKSVVFPPGRDMRMDGAFGGPPGGFRPGQGINVGLLRNIRGPPNSAFMLLPGGPMMQMPIPQGGIPRNNSDADRWQRASSFQRGLIPSPQNALPAIHKAENRYEVGKVSDEEECKQRQLKAILNKLTPQNFDKLFEQVKEVNIDSAVTLNGVISQIYDKALTEPTFCEMYANFCVHLAEELPKFNEDNEKITFKRVLLNKCQEEFQRGEREQAEADRIEEDGEVKLSEDEREQKRTKARRRMLGNIRFIGELYKKRMLTERIMHECIKKLLGEYQNPDEENVEALCKLMSTIGHLIDHSKAKEHIDAYFDRMTKLSNNQKLSSRLRFMLKDVIDLRKNGWQQRRKVEGPKKIEEVHRDAVQERQAQGGRLTRGGPGMGSLGRRSSQPSDYGLHGAASQMHSSGAPMGSLQQMAGGMRGPLPQMGVRGFGGQDVRLEDRHPMENRSMFMPLSQKHPDEVPLTLGPQGGLGRGMSVRGQIPSAGRSALADVPPIAHGDSRRIGLTSMSNYNLHSGSTDRMTYGGRDEVLSRNVSVERPSYLFEKPLLEKPAIQERSTSGTVARDFRSLDRSLDKTGIAANHGSRFQGDSFPGIQQCLLEKPQPSEERLREMCMQAIKEFYSVRDMKEAAMCVEDLGAPMFYPTMVSLWVTDSFDGKDIERDLLSKLLINLCKSEPALLNRGQLIKGFEVVLSSLEDTVVDAPKAPEFLGGILAKVVLADIFSFDDVARLTKEGGSEPGSLLDTGLSLDVLGNVLEVIRKEKGEVVMSDIYRKSRLRLEDFMSPNEKRPGKFDAFLEKKNIQCLYPLISVEKQIREFLVHVEPMEEILKWVEKNVSSSLQSDPAFVRMVMTQVIRQCVPLSPIDYERVLKGKLKPYAPLLRQFAPGRQKQRHYIAAIQLFVNELGHPPGLMTALFDNLYIDEVISEETYFSWQDDVRDPIPGRDQAIREVGKWLFRLSQAPEAED